MSTVTTFSTFTMARLGIYVSQKALDITGNNIANINTTGYTRQSLDIASLNLQGSDRYYSKGDVKIGQGAIATSTSQTRDQYLDIRFRNENASVGAMEARINGLDEIAAVLDEVGLGDDGAGVLEAQFNDLISQMQKAVATGAGKDDFDTLVRSSASSLTGLFNQAANRLNTLYDNMKTGFEQDVEAVNNILTRITDLNASIRKSDIHGAAALELRDERNLLIDELSKYIKIDVTYEQEEFSPGQNVERLVIKVAGQDPMNTDANDAMLIYGNYGGQLAIRTPSDNFDLDITPLKNSRDETSPDDKGATLVELYDNTLYGALQTRRELLTEQGEYATKDQVDMDANAGSKRGIPFYQKALDTLAYSFATLMNEANTPDGGDGPDNALFSNGGQGTDSISAANISISEKWAEGSLKLLNSKETGAPTTDNSNLAHMLVILQGDHYFYTDSATDPDTKPDEAPVGTVPFFTGSFQKFFTNHVDSILASDQKITGTLFDTYKTSADELDVDRDSVSGVDLNDETMSLIQYQKTYSAACRLMTVVDQVLDKLINGTAV